MGEIKTIADDAPKWPYLQFMCPYKGCYGYVYFKLGKDSRKTERVCTGGHTWTVEKIEKKLKTW